MSWSRSIAVLHRRADALLDRNFINFWPGRAGCGEGGGVLTVTLALALGGVVAAVAAVGAGVYKMLGRYK
jgi:hypothetical protein